MRYTKDLLACTLKTQSSNRVCILCCPGRFQQRPPRYVISALQFEPDGGWPAPSLVRTFVFCDWNAAWLPVTHRNIPRSVRRSARARQKGKTRKETVKRRGEKFDLMLFQVSDFSLVRFSLTGKPPLLKSDYEKTGCVTPVKLALWTENRTKSNRPFPFLLCFGQQKNCFSRENRCKVNGHIFVVTWRDDGYNVTWPMVITSLVVYHHVQISVVKVVIAVIGHPREKENRVLTGPLEAVAR